MALSAFLQCPGFSQIEPRNLNAPSNPPNEQFTQVVRFLRSHASVIENTPSLVAIPKAKIPNTYLKAVHARTVVLPAVASDFGVQQLWRQVFVFSQRDRLTFKSDFAEPAQALIELQKVGLIVTARNAISHGREWQQLKQAGNTSPQLMALAATQLKERW